MVIQNIFNIYLYIPFPNHIHIRVIFWNSFQLFLYVKLNSLFFLFKRLSLCSKVHILPFNLITLYWNYSKFILSFYKLFKFLLFPISVDQINDLSLIIYFPNWWLLQPNSIHHFEISIIFYFLFEYYQSFYRHFLALCSFAN